MEQRFSQEKAYVLFTTLKPSFKKEILRELREIIALREKVASVTKRYEKQATANRKAGAGAAAKGPKPEGKGFNHESYAQGSSKGKSKSKAKGGKQEKRKENASSTRKEKDLSDIEYYNCYKKGHYATTCAEPDTREKSKDKQSTKPKKD
jgi:hypothetical protein